VSEGQPAAPLLRVEGLGKRFEGRGGSVVAIKQLSFAIDTGEFLGVVGPSGGGKTTLVRLIAGLLRPTEGHVLLNGRLITGPPPDLLVVFQQYEKSLLPWRTVEGNVEFGLQNRPLPRPQRRERVAAALAAVGLTASARQYPRHLSGGMQQRVAIARALARQPHILIMDEPFSSLDALTRAELQDLLLRLWQDQRQTVLFVTHDVDEAVYLATRILVLSARPARVRGDIPVPLPYPRNQVGTRETSVYLAVRHRVYDLVRTKEETDGSRASVRAV
jgi:NitT/TauT family transport system ATP-binding protein